MIFFKNLFKNSLALEKTKRFLHLDVSRILQNDIVKKYLIAVVDDPSLQTNASFEDLIRQKKNLESEMLALVKLQETDKDMLKLIDEEKERYQNSICEINEQILLSLVPSCEENRDVVLEVTAGVGGKEAMLFAGDLFEMYKNYFSFKRWQWELQELDTSDLGGIRHGSALVTGREAQETLMQESGVHRVQRIPATERSGRIHTSTVTVAVLPQPTEVEVVINPKDIEIETKTSSGAGGQHVNKTESCVRITHLPTGIIIENQTERNQQTNKKLALQRLRSKLYQMELDGIINKTKSSRKEQVGTSMRSEKVRTYNFNQDRVTDHRIGVSLHNLPGFLSGGQDLDELITQLRTYNLEQKLLKVIEELLKTKNAKDR